MDLVNDLIELMRVYTIGNEFLNHILIDSASFHLYYENSSNIKLNILIQINNL